MTIKEFAEALAPIVRYHFVGDMRGKWVLGQILYVKTGGKKGPTITNAPY